MMSAERSLEQYGRVQAAIEELKGKVLEKYPSAAFDVSPNPDEPGEMDILTYVDLDDPDEVLDHVIDRVLEMQLEEDLPVHVIPLRRH